MRTRKVSADIRQIRLGEHRAFGGDSKLLNTIASVPYFILGVLSAAWALAERRSPVLSRLFKRRQPYRSVPVDDDAELLGEYED